jgi:hypothetical protein
VDGFSARWTPRTIKEHCGRSHSRYKRELEERYAAYFGDRAELAGTHPRKARDLAAALPPQHGQLKELVPEKAWHLHHLSGGSSQVLAVGLLGSAIEMDPSFEWLSSLLELPQALNAGAPKATFEYALDQQTLNEQPHVTNVDLLVEGEDMLICLEAKLWEQGLGSCRCGQERSDGDPADAAPEQEPRSAQERAACSARILERTAYWSASREVLGLPERQEGKRCPIAACYQAVRNVAAARALADSRSAAFALFYDKRNPYFSPCGEWPGWPAALTNLIREESGVRFRSCSWQALLASGAVPSDVVQWAKDKHGLVGSPNS